MRILICTGLLLALTACDGTGNDQCLRREIFTECIELIPDLYRVDPDIIKECRDTSYYLSKRKSSEIREECRK